MGKFVRGDIVVINFPFSDLTGSKRRPALVLSDMDGDDIILCQITGQSKTDRYAIRLDSGDYVDGSLKVDGFVRPNKLFTADSNVILYKACEIRSTKMSQITASIVKLITGNQ